MHCGFVLGDVLNTLIPTNPPIRVKPLLGPRRSFALAIDRNLRARLIWTAERLNRATRKPHGGGALGLAALSIYRCLLFRWGDRPAPTYRALRTATGHCVQTIATAIKRLEAAGLVFVTRGTIRTPLGPRKVANRYTFPPAAPLILIPRSPLVQSKPKKWEPLERSSPALQEALTRLQLALNDLTPRPETI